MFEEIVMKAKQVIIVRTDLPKEFLENRGKIAAQVAHASLGALLSCSNMQNSMSDIGLVMLTLRMGKNGAMHDWLENKFTKICLKCNSLEELLELEKAAKDAHFPCALITDAGDTIFNHVPTVTCLGIGPAWDVDLDKITKHLKLLR